MKMHFWVEAEVSPEMNVVSVFTRFGDGSLFRKVLQDPSMWQACGAQLVDGPDPQPAVEYTGDLRDIG